MALTLTGNAIYSALSNMVLNLRVDDHDLGDFAKYFRMFEKGVSPFAKYFRIINTNNVPTYEFNGISDANHTLLTVENPAVDEQYILLDKYRQVQVSVEHFKSKVAFGTADCFSQFVSNIEKWLSDTFTLYMGSVANVYIGVLAPDSGAAGKKSQTITLSKSTGSGNANEEALLRLRAGEIAQDVQRILDEMKDARTDYNTLGYRRTCSNPKLLWHAKYARLLKKGLAGSTLFNQVDLQLDNVIPERFFGTLATAAVTADGSKDRAAVEQDITVSGTKYHLMPGDLIPTGGSISASSGLCYQNNSAEGSAVAAGDVICKIVDPDAIIFATAQNEVTSFENPQNHIRNNWETWVYGVGTDTGKALVTVKAAIAS